MIVQLYTKIITQFMIGQLYTNNNYTICDRAAVYKK